MSTRLPVTVLTDFGPVDSFSTCVNYNSNHGIFGPKI